MRPATSPTCCLASRSSPQMITSSSRARSRRLRWALLTVWKPATMRLAGEQGRDLLRRRALRDRNRHRAQLGIETDRDGGAHHHPAAQRSGERGEQLRLGLEGDGEDGQIPRRGRLLVGGPADLGSPAGGPDLTGDLRRPFLGALALPGADQHRQTGAGQAERETRAQAAGAADQGDAGGHAPKSMGREHTGMSSGGRSLGVPAVAADRPATGCLPARSEWAFRVGRRPGSRE